MISSSPNDLAPVFDSILANATRLCEAHLGMLFMYDGDAFTAVAMQGAGPTAASSTTVGQFEPGRRLVWVECSSTSGPFTFPISRMKMPTGSAIRCGSRRVELLGARTFLAVPLVKDSAVAGAVVIYRREVRPFSEPQIGLVQTFADQAVIAIENVRLFQELQARTEELAQSVEQLRSLSEVSQAVNSTLDLQEVLSTIVKHAVQLSAADGGAVYEATKTRAEFRLRATYGLPQELVEAMLATPLRPARGRPGGQRRHGRRCRFPTCAPTAPTPADFSS